MFSPSDFLQRRSDLDWSIAKLCYMSGKLPSELFGDIGDDDWLHEFSYNLRIANVFWENYIAMHR